ncbi:uncharacterized protein [Eurosta solidaginis]|uniref:uncharacterized protein isoform X2 n=1 Tax=Eurosta solidaginis TaxID=178769 RepID=UPI00353146E1
MTHTTQIENCIKLQEQHILGHSELNLKVKNFKLASTQRATRAAQSMSPHNQQRLLDYDEYHQYEKQDFREQYQQQELRTADTNLNAVNGHALVTSNEQILDTLQEQQQQQQVYNKTTSKMNDSKILLQHNTTLCKVENKKKKLANNAAAASLQPTTNNNYNTFQVQSQTQCQVQRRLSTNNQLLSMENYDGKSMKANSRSSYSYYRRPQQQQQLQQTYWRCLRSSFGYTQIFSILLLLVSQHFPCALATSNLLSKHEPMFISRSETFKFVAGDTIRLPCEVANTDPYVVAWKRGIAILTAGNVKVTPDPRVSRAERFNLQIRDAVPQDAGDYICQIATMEPREITHTVEILVPPRIHHISTGGHLQVKKGSSVRIECSASGNPTPNVTWSRKNNILPSGEEKLHSHILSIENVDRHKGGVYICTANNGVGQPASSQVVLHVLYPPEISVERPIVFSGEGHEAMLVCIVHGETQPEVIWFKDTMQLDTTERHIMENRGSRHTLIIRKVHPQDFGNYSCVAENQLGKARKTLQLSGKPNIAVFNSPPISQYKDRYNISWTVDSHTPIEEYKLSFRRLPQGHEVDNSIDSHSGSSSTTLLQMYGGSGGVGSMGSGLLGNQHNHRLGSSLGSGLSSYGNVLHWGRNDWRDVVLPAMPLSHHYTQGMSYMIRGLDPDQHYEATVQARNRYGWSDLTHSFLFSTSSNDNEMRDLSVTFYGSGATHKLRLSLTKLSCVTLVLAKFIKCLWN